MISVSPPCASIVILFEVVASVRQRHLLLNRQQHLILYQKIKHWNRLFLGNCPEEVSAVGNVNVKDDDILPAFKPT